MDNATVVGGHFRSRLEGLAEKHAVIGGAASLWGALLGAGVAVALSTQYHLLGTDRTGNDVLSVKGMKAAVESIHAPADKIKAELERLKAEVERVRVELGQDLQEVVIIAESEQGDARGLPGVLVGQPERREGEATRPVDVVADFPGLRVDAHEAAEREQLRSRYKEFRNLPPGEQERLHVLFKPYARRLAYYRGV